MPSIYRKLGLATLTLLLTLTLAELILIFAQPMQYIVPVMDWTPEYGCISYPNQSIINAKPRHWKFIYTTNEARYRGPVLTHQNPDKKTIVILGDSNMFGWGLNDEQTVPAKLQHFLGDSFRVYNMANGGWSLPQQVRRYLELAEAHSPDYAILHMAKNDLNDKAYGVNWVAQAEDSNNITLHAAPPNPSSLYRKLLPINSKVYQIVLRSQVFMRCKTLIKKKFIRDFAEVRTYNDGSSSSNQSTVAEKPIPAEQIIVMNEAENERRYIKLLRAFAGHLKQAGVPLIFLTDDAEIYGYEVLQKAVGDMTHSGILDHYPISQWFEARKDYPASPQGHQWGTEAAQRLAKELFYCIQTREESK